MHDCSWLTSPALTWTIEASPSYHPSELRCWHQLDSSRTERVVHHCGTVLFTGTDAASPELRWCIVGFRSVLDEGFSLDHCGRLHILWRRRHGELTSVIQSGGTETAGSKQSQKTLCWWCEPHSNQKCRKYETNQILLLLFKYCTHMTISCPSGSCEVCVMQISILTLAKKQLFRVRNSREHAISFIEHEDFLFWHDGLMIMEWLHVNMSRNNRTWIASPHRVNGAAPGAGRCNSLGVPTWAGASCSS